MTLYRARACQIPIVYLNGRHMPCVEEISHLDIELTGSSHIFYQRHLDCVFPDYAVCWRFSICAILLELLCLRLPRGIKTVFPPLSRGPYELHYRQTAVGGRGCCATGSLSRGTAAAKKLGWRNQRDEGTSTVVAPQFKSEDRP